MKLNLPFLSWLGVAWFGFFVLPWYAAYDGFWSFIWVTDGYPTFDEYSPLSLYTKDNNSATTWYKDAGISLFKSTCERRWTKSGSSLIGTLFSFAKEIIFSAISPLPFAVTTGDLLTRLSYRSDTADRSGFFSMLLMLSNPPICQNHILITGSIVCPILRQYYEQHNRTH